MSNDTIGELNHGRILTLREESDGDNKSLSIGVWKGNASFTVWAGGKKAASFPLTPFTEAMLRQNMKIIQRGESKLTRFPCTKRDYNQDDRKYVPKVQCALVVDMENDRPRIIIELIENKERFRFPVSPPKSFDVEACEYTKRDHLEISCSVLESIMDTEIPTAKRLSSWPRDNKGGYNKSGGGNNRGSSSSRNDDIDSDEVPF